MQEWLKQALHDITGQLHIPYTIYHIPYTTYHIPHTTYHKFGLYYTPWYVVCGMWYVVCGMWYVVYGIWYMVYGVGRWCHVMLVFVIITFNIRISISITVNYIIINDFIILRFPPNSCVGLGVPSVLLEVFSSQSMEQEN